MIQSELVIPKVWRSELERVALFFFFCAASVIGSDYFEWSIIKGQIFTIGNYEIYFNLPLIWLFFPTINLLIIMHKIYNVRYCIDKLGVERKEGILALSQNSNHVRYEDIRSVEIKQGVVDRLLDIGTLEISTASTSGIECILEGIEAPEEVRDMLNRERDAIRVSQAKQSKIAQKELDQFDENN